MHGKQVDSELPEKEIYEPLASNQAGCSSIGIWITLR